MVEVTGSTPVEPTIFYKMDDSLPVLSIRKITPEDAHFINDHWKDATEEDLERLGELHRPDPKGNIEFLKSLCSTTLDPKTALEDIRMWMVDGKTAGYCTLKQIQFGEAAQIHLHLARPFWGKGLGAKLFCLSAQDFIRCYQLKKLYCQPHSQNPMPNKMLQKIGFILLGPVDYERKDGSIIKQNRYFIDAATTELFLRQH